MRKTAYRNLIPQPISPSLDAYSFTVTVFELFSGHFEIFTNFISLCFHLSSELLAPGRKTRFRSLHSLP